MSDVAAETSESPEAVEARLGSTCSDLVSRATASGADEAEAFAVTSRSVSVRYEKGDLQLTQVDEGTSWGVRVFRDKRQGFATTNQSGDEARTSVTADALTLAGFGVPDDANLLPEARPIAALPPMVDPTLSGLGVESIVERAHGLVAATLAVDPRVSLDQASMEVSTTTVAVASSTGVSAAESDAHLSMMLFGMAIDGDDVGGFDYQGFVSRELERVAAARSGLVNRFTAAALGNLGAGASESYEGPVLFSPAAFAEIFVSPLVSAASAIAVQRGRSVLAGKVGEQVADARLAVRDDPTDLGLAGAASFDREGQPCGAFPIVEGGVLRGLLYNNYAARMDGVQSTGHAAGGARAVPGLGTHALSVDAGGGGDEAAMVAALDRGLIVNRFSGTVDPASGDFSGVAKSARWVEGGKVVRPVRETLIAGNALKLLSSLVALSSEREELMGSTRMPWALIDGVSVTAG